MTPLHMSGAHWPDKMTGLQRQVKVINYRLIEELSHLFDEELFLS